MDFEESNLISNAKEDILKLWEELITSERPEVKKYTSFWLRDHLPVFLDCMNEVVNCKNIEKYHNKREALAVQHGLQRTEVEGFSLDQVIDEYRALRKSIFIVIEKNQGIVTTQIRDLILEVIEAGISDAATAFIERQFNHEQLQRVRAEKTARRLEDLHTVTEAALISSVSLPNLLNDLCERIREIFNIDTVMILLLNANKDKLVVKAAIGVKEEAILNYTVPTGKGVSGKIFESKKPLIILDFAKAEFIHPVLHERGVTSFMGVPLILSGMPIGVLHIGSIPKREFKNDDLTQFEIIADRIAIAIDHARLYEETRSQVKELEEEKRLREHLAAAISHDLRTPLTASKLSLNLALRSDRVSVKDTQAMKAIEGINRADRMIQDLLDAHRVSAGQEISGQTEYFELNELIESVREEVCVLKKAVCDINGDDRVSGYWNRDGLRRVLENLVSNAIKYGDAVSPIKIELKRIGQERCQLAVINKGNPIPENLKKHIFEAFKRGHSEKTFATKGWGLGLAIAKGIIDAHKGEIICESDKEHTAFIITLPLDSRSR